MTNPANALARILAAMIDDHGKVQIPGFYDDVVPLTDRERQELAALPFDEAEFFAEHRRYRQRWAKRAIRRWSGAGPGRPSTSAACGAATRGEGAKTVLPAKAGAKFSFRLVPNQDPQQDHRRPEAMADRGARRGSSWSWWTITARPACWCRWRAPMSRRRPGRSNTPSAGRPVYTREGGSIPIVAELPRGSEGRYAVIGLGPGRRQRP